MIVSQTIAGILKRGFRGPRPGSNTFPLLQLGKLPDRVCGEEIEGWIRQGLIRAVPVTGDAEIIRGGDAGPYGEIPDVEITHRYELTEAGRTALAAPFTGASPC